MTTTDLPKELLENIVNRLESETDHRRFRGVCSSWRSSTPPPLTKFPLKLPFPLGPTQIIHQNAYFNLIEKTVYLLQNPEIHEENNCWIVKTEMQEDGKIRILNPVSNRQIKVLPKTLLPNVLNTLNFRVFEVCKAYYLKYVNELELRKVDYGFHCVKKVAVSPYFGTDEFVVMAIDENDKLWCIKNGDEKWTMVCPDLFSDIVNYKGQFYGVGVAGGACVFDSSFKATRITYGICYPASKRHLVDLHDGELCLVEEITDENKRVCTCYDVDDGCTCRFPRTPVRNTNVEIIVSRIDKTIREWVEVKKLDDRIIFVGDDCSFSVLAKEIKGFKGTCVFYTDRYIFFQTEEKKPCGHGRDVDCWCYDDGDEDYYYFECDCCGSPVEGSRVDNFIPSDDVKLKFRGMHGHNTGVCDLETRKLGSLLMFPEYADIFWPPPPWLNRV